MDLVVFRAHLKSLGLTLSSYLYPPKQGSSDGEVNLNVETMIVLAAALRSILAQLWRFVEPPTTNESPIIYPAISIVGETIERIMSTSSFGDEVIWSLAVILSDPGWTFHESSHFRDILRRSCKHRKLLGWKKLLALLRRYIYFAAMQKVAIMHLWREISTC